MARNKHGLDASVKKKFKEAALRRLKKREWNRSRPSAQLQTSQATVTTDNDPPFDCTSYVPSENSFKLPLSYRRVKRQGKWNGRHNRTPTDHSWVQSHHLNKFGLTSRPPKQLHSGFDSRNPHNPRTFESSRVVQYRCDNPVRTSPILDDTEISPVPSGSGSYLNNEEIRSWNSAEKEMQVQETRLYHGYSESLTIGDSTGRCSNYKNELHVHEKTVFRNPSYEARPQDHPSYAIEWQNFCQRHMELKSQGKNFTNHELKLDWIAFWERRLKELNQEMMCKPSSSSNVLHYDSPMNTIQLQTLSFYNQHLDPRRNQVNRGKYATQSRILFTDQLRDPIPIPTSPI